MVFELGLPDQRPLHGPELGPLGNASLGEHAAREAVHVQNQRQAGAGLGQNRPVRDGVQGPVLQTHRGVGIVTVLTPCRGRGERGRESGEGGGKKGTGGRDTDIKKKS